MTNDNLINNSEFEIEQKTSEQKVLSLKFFRGLVEKNPSAETIKTQLGEFGKEYEAPLPETLQKIKTVDPKFWR